MPAGGSRRPASHETVDQRLHYVKQEGQTVFKFASGQSGRRGLALGDGLGDRLVVDDGEGLGDQGRLGPGIGRAGGATTAPTQDAEEVAQHQTILRCQPQRDHEADVEANTTGVAMYSSLRGEPSTSSRTTSVASTDHTNTASALGVPSLNGDTRMM